jgi:hypothetical protein
MAPGILSLIPGPYEQKKGRRTYPVQRPEAIRSEVVPLCQQSKGFFQLMDPASVQPPGPDLQAGSNALVDQHPGTLDKEKQVVADGFRDGHAINLVIKRRCIGSKPNFRDIRPDHVTHAKWLFDRRGFIPFFDDLFHDDGL